MHIGVLGVGLGVLQVNLLVRHVQVAAHNHWLLGVKLLQMLSECVVRS